ncbi:MAG: FAD/NAD(P)-binding protein [Rhodospirillaceae bacterium]
MMSFDIPSAIHTLTPQFVRVSWVENVLPDVVSIGLEAPIPDSEFAFAPGQFVMAYAFGIGEIPISLSGDPSLAKELVVTVRNVGAVSRALTLVQPGSVIGIRGPYGQPWPLDQARDRDIVVVAGGLGLAPLRSLLFEILAERKNYKTVTLLYGTRSPDTVLFQGQLSEWNADGAIDVRITVDSAGKTWTGNVGLVTKLLDGIELEPANTKFFICGPEVMMRFVGRALTAKNIALSDIYLSLERNMKCAIGECGRCQLGPFILCRDGPVLPFSAVERLLTVAEI